MATLGVNIDHVATIREARRTIEPDPVWAAAAAEIGGADAITIHLREDRRHIQDRDLEVLRKTVQVKLNLELAMSPLMVDIACQIVPDQVTLVPENREEVTTEGGLDVVRYKKDLVKTIGKLQDAGITVSLFIDPEPAQIETAASLSVPAVELHTGAYANAVKSGSQRTPTTCPSSYIRPSGGPHSQRGSWTYLSQCHPNSTTRGNGRIKHWALNRRPGCFCWYDGSRTRNEKSHNSLISNDKFQKSQKLNQNDAHATFLFLSFRLNRI